jgi:hypothetical protein
VKSDKLEIGRILHLKLEIKKSQIGQSDGTSLFGQIPIGFEFSDFGFDIQESFDFEIVRFHDSSSSFLIF